MISVRLASTIVDRNYELDLISNEKQYQFVKELDAFMKGYISGDIADLRSIRKARDKNFGKGKSKPCLVEGVVYANRQEAADRYGLTRQAVMARIKNPKYKEWKNVTETNNKEKDNE